MSLMLFQNTISREIKLVGLGAYTRKSGGVRIKPAGPDTGIIFSHKDHTIEASIKNAVYGGSEMRTTVLQNGYRVICTEHLLAALSLAHVTNAEIELTDNDSPDEFEIPLFDGSAYHFYEALQSAGIEPNLDEDYQHKRVQKAFRIIEPIEVTQDGRSMTALPLDKYTTKDYFRLYVEIDYKNPAIGRQNVELTFDGIHKKDLECLLMSRTFCFKEDLIKLEKAGDQNIVDLASKYVMVIDEMGNPAKKLGGFKYFDEAVLHKTIDVIGDLSLLGYPIIGEVRAVKPGHEINQRMAMKIYLEAQKENGKAELVFID
ncbi:MAG: UDP-3-O-acyl-N-acetylglucosamine deacetylase [Nanoarchaeota archaeon]|nr:UDP-3-O-acyl-N-acetylglucosamine deacetylase [Nanoarchaeota archaeon]